jgi:hypothetical protein
MDAPLPDGLVEEWERLLKLPPSMEVPFSSPIAFPLQRRRELTRMLHAVRKAQTVVDVGSDKGGGVYCWCVCLPKLRRVVVCEPRGVPYAKLFEHAFPWLEFVWHAGPSSTLSVPDGVDVAFLDGDKLRFAEDFHTVWPSVTRGGWVFFHDIQIEQPRAAFEQCKRYGSYSFMYVNTSEYKERSGRPARTAHDAWLLHWQNSSCGVGGVQK